MLQNKGYPLINRMLYSILIKKSKKTVKTDKTKERFNREDEREDTSARP